MRAVIIPKLVEALQRYHLEDTEVVDDLLLSQAGGQRHRNPLLPPRRLAAGPCAMGAKLITAFWDNPNSTNGLPAVQAVYVLFDGANGQPLAALDGTALTLRKTAADSALGSRFLARADVATMLMVGAGALAPHLIMAHCAIRPSIERVMVWNRTRSRAEALAEKLAIGGVTLEVVDDLETAARGADLISSATMTTDPLIRGAWLRPGTHLDLVGAFKPDMREADDDALRCASIFVDSRQTTIEHVGELKIPLAAKVITEADILADHYDFARGRHAGRRGANEITLFKNGGGGHLDLMTARFVVAQAP